LRSFGNNSNTIYTLQITFLMPVLPMLSTEAERSFRVAVKRTQDLLGAPRIGFSLSFNTGTYFSIAKSKMNENVPPKIDLLYLKNKNLKTNTPKRTTTKK
jgi:hypothetical protein